MGYIPRRKIIWFLTGVDFILQSDLNRITSECDGADCGDFWVDASDAGDEKVRFREVEEGRVSECGDGGCSVDFGFAGDELADGSFRGTVGRGKERGEAGDGDVLGEDVEFGDALPDFTLGGELGLR